MTMRLWPGCVCQPVLPPGAQALLWMYKSEGPFVFCMEIHGRSNPAGNDWLKVSISANRPIATVTPLNPDAGVADRLRGYVAMPTTLAPMRIAHVSFRRMCAPEVNRLRLEVARRVADRGPPLKLQSAAPR